MNAGLNFTFLMLTSIAIAGKKFLTNSSVKNNYPKTEKIADSSAKELIGIWVLSDNEKHERPFPVKKLIISATEIFFYTDNKLLHKTKYSVIADTAFKNPTNTISLLVNMVDIYEQWNFQVLIPQNTTPHTYKESITLVLIPDTDCKCNCPYEIYNQKEK